MILVINCGSTSIKYELFADLETVLEGRVGEIGERNSFVQQTSDGEEMTEKRRIGDHHEGMSLVLECVTHPEHGVGMETSELTAVGHRVVHGGELTEPRLVDESVKATIRDYAPIAPLHNPASLQGIEAVETHLPESPQVAVFDTAFHRTMPPTAYLYGLPYEYYEERDIRRYGFHGISHAFVAKESYELLGKPPTETNLLTCHLGGGCSLTAVEGGHSIDTSMGFSPLEGTLMATRAGDVDPTVLKYLVDNYRMDLDDVFEVLNERSGLAGLSGLSGDMRELLQARRDGSERADLAIRTFANSIRKRIGSLAVTLGDVDALVYTAGMGENVPLIRELTGNLSALGAEIDDRRNESAVGERAVISTDESDVDILVVPTNEELRIARQSRAKLSDDR